MTHPVTYSTDPAAKAKMEAYDKFIRQTNRLAMLDEFFCVNCRLPHSKAAGDAPDTVIHCIKCGTRFTIGEAIEKGG